MEIEKEDLIKIKQLYKRLVNICDELNIYEHEELDNSVTKDKEEFYQIVDKYI